MVEHSHVKTKQLTQIESNFEIYSSFKNKQQLGCVRFTLVLKSHQGPRTGWTETFSLKTRQIVRQCRDLGCMHESFGKRGSPERSFNFFTNAQGVMATFAQQYVVLVISRYNQRCPRLNRRKDANLDAELQAIGQQITSILTNFYDL